MTMSAPMNEIDDLILLSKNANALILGGPAKEGGDIRVYRDGSGNIALSFDADAASNTEGLNLYAGVVCQNGLTIGQTTFQPAYDLYVAGTGRFSSYIRCLNASIDNYITASNNNTDFYINVPVTTGTNVHPLALQIDENNIIVVQATGDGAGGITNKAIGLYGVTPVVQAAHIADPAESIAANNAAIDAILVILENLGACASV